MSRACADLGIFPGGRNFSGVPPAAFGVLSPAGEAGGFGVVATLGSPPRHLRAPMS